MGVGLLRGTETNEVRICGLPAEETRSIDIQFGPESATAVEETLYEPMTCETYDGELYSMDLTTTFEGTLIENVPPPVGEETDLDGYLTSRGLSCDQVTARVETSDLQLPGSRYEVTTTRAAQGEVLAVDASVTSLDASMPSDAGGFLKGVAARTPVVDQVGLAAWFDEAIDGGESRFASGPWSGVWTATAIGNETVWALRIEQSGAASESVPPLRGGTAVEQTAP